MAGGFSLCTRCGLELVTEFEARRAIVGVVITPVAQAQMDAGKGSPEALQLIERIKRLAEEEKKS